MKPSNRVKQIAPYGKELEGFLEWNTLPRNDVFIFCGINAWKKASALKQTQFVLCLPLGSEPCKYVWPVKDCSILLFDTGGVTIANLEEFSYHLLKVNAAIVRSITFSGVMIVYRRTF